MTALDVSAAVRAMLTKLGVAPRFAELTPRALSYLVLTHDGLYDDAHDVYKVAFTSRLNAAKGLLPLPDGQDLSHATVLGLVSRHVLHHGLVLADGSGHSAGQGVRRPIA